MQARADPRQRTYKKEETYAQRCAKANGYATNCRQLDLRGSVFYSAGRRRAAHARHPTHHAGGGQPHPIPKLRSPRCGQKPKAGMPAKALALATGLCTRAFVRRRSVHRLNHIYPLIPSRTKKILTNRHLWYIIKVLKRPLSVLCGEMYRLPTHGFRFARCDRLTLQSAPRTTSYSQTQFPTVTDL